MREMHSIFLSPVCIANSRFSGLRTHFVLPSFPRYASELATLGQTHYKMISCNIWLPVVIHRSKTRNNALDVFWGIETIIMPLSRQPQKKSFCPVSHSLAPTFMKIFFIMRLPCYASPYNPCHGLKTKNSKLNLIVLVNTLLLFYIKKNRNR